MQDLSNPAPKQKISAQAFAARYRSKKEIFNFLSSNVGCYLCSHENLSIYYLKAIMEGKRYRRCLHLLISPFCRKYVKCDRVSYIYVP